MNSAVWHVGILVYYSANAAMTHDINWFGNVDNHRLNAANRRLNSSTSGI